MALTQVLVQCLAFSYISIESYDYPNEELPLRYKWMKLAQDDVQCLDFLNISIKFSDYANMDLVSDQKWMKLAEGSVRWWLWYLV
jgi:hypothetical protein